MNVIQVSSINLVKRTITFKGGPNDIFILNVAGSFTFSSSQMILSGGVLATNVLWNFLDAGPDVKLYKDITVEVGVFLAPLRLVSIDHTTLSGSVIALDVNIHPALS